MKYFHDVKRSMRDTNGCLMKWIDCNDLGPEVKLRMREMLLVWNYGKDDSR